MSFQTKLKFNVHADQLPRLRSLPLIRRISVDRATTQSLSTTYFDTERGDLRDMGVSLRVRSVGGNLLQTVKTSAEAVGNGRTKYVFEAPVPTERPMLSIIMPPTLRRRVQEVPSDTLAPLFRVDVKRTSRLVSLDGGSRASLDIDLGAIDMGDETVTIADLELSTSREPLHLLYELALQIHERVPLVPTMETESDVGYRHLGLKPIVKKDADGTTVGKRQRREKAFMGVLQACFERLQFVANCLHEGASDAFGADDLVIVQRLRTTIRHFRRLLPKHTYDLLLSEMDWITGVFKTWQDWTKFERRLIAPVAKHLGDTVDLAALRDAIEAECTAARAAVGKALMSPRFSKLLLELGYCLAKQPWRGSSKPSKGAGSKYSVRALAADALSDHSLRIHKLAKRATKVADEKHPLLIEEIRDLRRTVDLFGNLYPAKKVAIIANRIERVEAAQAYLEALALAWQSADRLTKGSVGARAAKLSLGIVLGWHAKSRKAAERKLHREVQLLVAEKPPWRRSRG